MQPWLKATVVPNNDIFLSHSCVYVPRNHTCPCKGYK